MYNSFCWPIKFLNGWLNVSWMCGLVVWVILMRVNQLRSQLRESISVSLDRVQSNVYSSFNRYERLSARSHSPSSPLDSVRLFKKLLCNRIHSRPQQRHQYFNCYAQKLISIRFCWWVHRSGRGNEFYRFSYFLSIKNLLFSFGLSRRAVCRMCDRRQCVDQLNAFNESTRMRP